MKWKMKELQEIYRNSKRILKFESLLLAVMIAGRRGLKLADPSGQGPLPPADFSRLAHRLRSWAAPLLQDQGRIIDRERGPTEQRSAERESLVKFEAQARIQFAPGALGVCLGGVAGGLERLERASGVDRSKPVRSAPLK